MVDVAVMRRVPVVEVSVCEFTGDTFAVFGTKGLRTTNLVKQWAVRLDATITVADFIAEHGLPDDTRIEFVAVPSA